MQPSGRLPRNQPTGANPRRIDAEYGELYTREMTDTTHRQTDVAAQDALDGLADNAGANKDGVINSKRVVFGLLDLLEHGKIVPGQRLVEADLCARFDVGRNAVREALHRLEEVGVVELSRNRGATVIERHLDDALQALELVEVLNGLAARVAARAVRNGADASDLSLAMSRLVASINNLDTASFADARRLFYATLLRLGGHKDLRRIASRLNIHVLRAQYGTSVHKAFAEDFMAIGSAVLAGNESAAEEAVRNHIRRTRENIGTLTQR
jgi:DNA-binding GntR family transcriptional regulator